MDIENKKDVQSKNEAFRERFQFVLWVNENVVCQRYFKVIGYNKESIHSTEFLDTLNNCVRMIQDDLKYKSWLYQYLVTNKPLKMTGFVNNINPEDILLLTNCEVEGNVELSDGSVVNKTFLSYDEDGEDIFSENEQLEPYEVMFKFELLVDDKPVYQRVWDGTIYNKNVRNSVDLSNQGQVCDFSKINLNSMESVSKYLKCGRTDLIYNIIKLICGIMSSSVDGESVYNNILEYKNTDDEKLDRKYYCSTYNKDYVKGYQKWLSNKTNKYYRELY